tara:strand:+ start:255 stop:494 length:240 start_codon:yes stop_codon:yes gene_type:complete
MYREALKARNQLDRLLQEGIFKFVELNNIQYEKSDFQNMTCSGIEHSIYHKGNKIISAVFKGEGAYMWWEISELWRKNA